MSEDDRGWARPFDVGSWLSQLPRWLATLNPGRTPREYEKAVRYFFETPGVPDALEDLTFDLLLAYRGALARRAAPAGRPHKRTASTSARQARIPASERDHLLEGARGAASEAAEGADGADAKPLAPATVNIRLTALRQFLVYCALSEALPQLTTERIRLALRRLAIERRRPYQVLAESEWADFLAAALLPSRLSGLAQAQAGPDESASDHARGESASVDAQRVEEGHGPWGRTRAERLERAQVTDSEHAARSPARKPAPLLPKSRAGLTGVRTAQRDHALLSLALATGLRAIELSLLDVADLTREWHDGQEEWWLVLPDEKTKGQRGGRTLPLAPQLVEVLLAYVRSTGRRWEEAADRKTPLFVSRPYVARHRAQIPAPTRGNGMSQGNQRTAFARLSTVQIRAVVDRVEQHWLELRAQAEDGPLAGETRMISPHALRHSTALALLEGRDTSRPPASVEHVRGWLGHFDIRTTQGYLAHLDARQHRRPFVLSPVADPPSAPTDANADPLEGAPPAR